MNIKESQRSKAVERARITRMPQVIGSYLEDDKNPSAAEGAKLLVVEYVTSANQLIIKKFPGF